MNKLQFYITLICISPSIGFFSCCHTSKLETDKLVFEINNVDAWLNLMPGETPKFHLAGRANIYSENELKDLIGFIKSINISQDQIQFYSFKPILNLLSDETNNEELFVYQIEFYSESGLRINPGMSYDKNIDIEFIFSNDLSKKNIFLSNVKLEKAY